MIAERGPIDRMELDQAERKISTYFAECYPGTLRCKALNAHVDLMTAMRIAQQAENEFRKRINPRDAASVFIQNSQLTASYQTVNDARSFISKSASDFPGFKKEYLEVEKKYREHNEIPQSDNVKRDTLTFFTNLRDLAVLRMPPEPTEKTGQKSRY